MEAVGEDAGGVTTRVAVAGGAELGRGRGEERGGGGVVDGVTALGTVMSTATPGVGGCRSE